MPNSKSIVGIIFLATLLSACGSDDTCDRPQPYVNSRTGAQLVVPDGLSTPDAGKRQEIPEIGPDRKARSNPCTSGPPDLVITDAQQLVENEATSEKPAGPVDLVPLVVGPGFNSENVGETVDAWISSWRAGNAPAYLSFYSKDFIGPDEGVTRDTWLRRRQSLLEVTGPADIVLRNITIEDLAGGRKLVRFEQAFTAKESTQAVVKLLEMVKEGEGWRIRQEKVVAVL